MRIAMLTNSYAPLVGGVERSVESFAREFRRLGHQTLVVAPMIGKSRESDEFVLRLPAIERFHGTEWSACLPFPPGLRRRLDGFEPDVIHCHQPFLLGDTALRQARMRALPLVYTNHTLFERYAGLLGIERAAARRIATNLPVVFANLCDVTVAPTPSVARILRERGVTTPLAVVPTGIDGRWAASGNRERGRRRHGIRPDEFVVAHVGRLVPAKNMEYIGASAARFLNHQPRAAKFLLVGEGGSVANVERQFQEAGVRDRVIITGKLQGQSLADAYAASDLFVFASKSDTQGLVLLESMAAGVPVLALDAPGPHDVIRDGDDGLLLPADTPATEFAEVMKRLANSSETLHRLGEAAKRRAAEFDRGQCAKRMLQTYRQAIEALPAVEPSAWQSVRERVKVEWALAVQKADLAWAALWRRNGGSRQASSKHV